MKLKDIPACLGVQDLTLAPRKQGIRVFFVSFVPYSLSALNLHQIGAFLRAQSAPTSFFNRSILRFPHEISLRSRLGLCFPH
ncbi:hypothetical protein MRB53_017198 [Persea americana]|uniref:Uncharacterized protein n=1 Tax=Persea americana TaxID=3435 RepID=A0ACC2M4H3_PERAE|nr:hypothetical protein MRB53_017198 [Persea americana]